MPRITVTAEPLSSQRASDAPVLLDEQVQSVHLLSDHAAAQLVERLAWAISDAEDTEIELSARPRRGRPAGDRGSTPRRALGARSERKRSARAARL
jgi:hypothetical protein